MSVLYIVATPIGNLEDITKRALRILEEVDFVLCEDTRVTRKLLNNYEIKTATISYHQHSGAPKVDKILEFLKAGKNLALVTDAGTPGISDPGAFLLTAIRQQLADEDISIVSVPGASALTSALSLAGIGFDRFLFLGFLPHKKGRQGVLKEIFASEHPVAIYESKHRIVKLLEELTKMSGELSLPLEVSVARELTKMYESFYRGAPEEILEQLQSDANNLKGEFVVLIRKIN
ncbi:16S rRNA (cytidine(1402)-2'-O)-methyltransferase [Candidatus Falkowbacteria bacterium]|uniref:Ribosomal RNA small subunit methyltransferase I n=1 Tax=Candidatus Falkowbacteria bacterium CG10_big_fil_rev_8_21_14_0_10_37_18 TaxID=1974562 RepID=A0A2H0V9A7_9BACT|nr:16S rRNA (cytidine(1402)-2'-O)-methyltransferase [Candidatus Falkowbacteria bacterium]NCQ12491.1 16S rRNA (cytidine(1402)-2'-O)-methyltransferase [Candidatus Falkowbacteria bacterium]OIO06078.1 MAG: 16S rRNA (cytidine(1402)-2'-O)-methyltransferase [Candidatus Falkowbacteria bacterium CG1_02_37_21]PIR95686.1 MAG: 16S rRNA (cytidine(1402)-2'-O)-methyltransferase [Candidatus Falkowbacteria bacterium CG10_big_fil_rev_8_21_14_0_10_37_18]